ncbi:MAG: hypothetical protein ACSHWY_03975 [Octadecabacter sp.]
MRVGRAGHWIWSRDGEETGRIFYQMKADGFSLDYKVRLYGGEWESIEQTIPVTYTDCNYGGGRPYFLCSGVVNGRHCGRRVGKLFAGGRYFLCRHCYHIAYGSQSEPKYDRMLRRANKLRVALGGEAGTAHWIAPKPKGMRHRTYERKRFEIWWCENQADILFIDKFSHLLSWAELADLV